MKSRILSAWQMFRYIYDVIFFGMLAYTVQVAFVKERPSVSVICYIAGAFLLSVLLRIFAPNNALLVGGHVLSAVLLLWLPGSVWLRAVTGCVLGCYLLPVSVAYVKRRCRPAPFSEPWPSMGTVVLLYIGGVATKQTAFANLAYGAAILMMCDYFLIRYAQGLFRYTEQIKDVSGLMVRTTISVNNKFVAGLALMTGLLMLACRFLNLDFLVQWIASGLSWLVGVLLTGILFFYVFFMTLLTGNGSQTSGSNIQEEINTYTASYEASHTAELLVEIFAALVLAFLFYQILKATVRFLTTPRTKENRQERETEKPYPILEKETIPDRTPPVKRTRKRQIRQAYRGMVLSYKKEIPLNETYTCGDIRAAIWNADGGDVSAATETYESVRYGNINPDRALIKEMNRLAKQGRKR